MLIFLIWCAILSPCIASVIVGLARSSISQVLAQTVCTLSIFISFCCSCYLAYHQFFILSFPVNANLFTWAHVGSISFYFGVLFDHLTAVMFLVVTFVSFLVHVYSFTYMQGDPGVRRFFSYMSLFTFSMLLLVSANNFLQLFIGWEGVGLVSYLLIGFWFKNTSAADGSLKAFIVNRVGDVGFILAIAAICDYTGSLSYHHVFTHISMFNQSVLIVGSHAVNLNTLICILLFIGAMGKSAQVPLHIWLPESMEGPTPISALIHAATMVTAGVFMIARMSPMFELSTTALSLVLIVGATTALFLGMVALVQNDIKRVIAYSTISQLGYMMTANGLGFYSAAIFHLMTHACFKALLFLAAGSVIIAMHHEQNMNKMGGLAKKMPITYITFLIGALALAAIPPFAGFYSKDAIIQAAKISVIPGSTYAYICVLCGSFITSLYIFRAFFLTFHGKPRSKHAMQAKESGYFVLIPLIMLAIPSCILGYLLIQPMLFAHPAMLADAIYTVPLHDNFYALHSEFTGFISTMEHAIDSLPFWFAVAAFVTAAAGFTNQQKWPSQLVRRTKFIYLILIKKFGFDIFYQGVIVRFTLYISRLLFHKGDLVIIDKLALGGTSKSFFGLSNLLKKFQSGNIVQYIIIMILSLVILLVISLGGAK